MGNLVPPNELIFAALVAAPSLGAWTVIVIARLIGGPTGTRVGIAIAATLTSVLLTGAILIILGAAVRGSLLSPRSGDEFLGLILSALVVVGSMAALFTMKLIWHRQARALHS